MHSYNIVIFIRNTFFSVYVIREVFLLYTLKWMKVAQDKYTKWLVLQHALPRYKGLYLDQGGCKQHTTIRKGVTGP